MAEQNVNLHDSVHVGDIVQNISGTNECPNCKTTNVPVFSCEKYDCSERWCPYCGTKKPGSCVSCKEQLDREMREKAAKELSERKRRKEEEIAEQKRQEAEFLARMRAIGAAEESERKRIIQLWQTRSTLAILLGWSVFFLTRYQFMLEHNVAYTFAAIASLGWWISAMIAFRKTKWTVGGLETLVLVSLPYVVSIIPIFIGPIFFIISFFIAIYAYYERPL